jgi:hypothetical protein
MGLRPTHMNENRFRAETCRIEAARNDKDRAYSGLVEAAEEFDLGCVFWTNLCDAVYPKGLDGSA